MAHLAGYALENEPGATKPGPGHARERLRRVRLHEKHCSGILSMRGHGDNWVAS